MTQQIVSLFLLLVGTATGLAAESGASVPRSTTPILRWDNLAEFPEPLGVAGPFAGVSSGVLVVAGGANFPDGPPWAGHAKAWHDRICVLTSPDGRWEWAAETLPTARAYGVSVTTPKGVLCIGGSDAQRHYDDVFLLGYADKRITRTALPPLPVPLANACGALVGNIVYVAGGTVSPTASEATKHFLALDLSQPAPAWKALEPWPGPERMLAVAAAQENSFFLISGVQLVPDAQGKASRRYLTDGYRYSPGAGWRRIADLPRAVAAAPSPAPAIGAAHVFVFGGDDGTQVNVEPRERHTGFSHDVLAYHTVTDTWSIMGQWNAPTVTTVAVPWANGYVFPSGESRPAVRSPAVARARTASNKAGFGVVNYMTLGIYLAAMVGIGAWFSRREKSTDQFFRGGQRIPWWAAGLSIYATMLSSITYMAVPAKSYASDWTFYWNVVGIFLIAPIVVYLYLPFYRQLNVTSAYEYLERRFNVAVRLFGSASFILLQVGRTSIVLYLPSLAMATVSSFNIYTCIVVMGVLCVVYTVMGGIEAVIWTDVVQSIVLAAGAVFACVLILLRVDGGVATAFGIASSNAKFFETVSFRWDTTAATATVVLVGSLFSNLVPYTASQDVVQRYVTTRDQKRAAHAIWMNAWISIPSVAMFFMVGTLLFVFYKTQPQRLDPTMPTDAIFPLFMVRELPIGIAGFIVAGVFAAAQSTLSGSLNSIATAYVTDFHRRFRPASSDLANLRLAQWITVLLGAVGVVVACIMASLNIVSIWDVFLAILGLTGSSLAGLFALGIFTRRANGHGALIGAVTSAAVLYYVQQHSQVNFLLYGAVGIIVCFVVGYVASLLIPVRQKPLDGLTLFTRIAKVPTEDAASCTAVS